ncbi:manno protein [Mycena crocata]|nr:manno protein [Mycena crocata]
MPSTTRSFLFLHLAVLLSAVNAADKVFPATPLASKRFSYPTGIPYQADTEPELERGAQFGYNICNSTTEGPASLCQTAMLNSIDDFCVWGPPKPGSIVGDTEGESVAWCTKPGRGTRLIPAGALQGVQFMKTPAYVQVVGFLNQELINLMADDGGGELDPHGADLRGNPLGALLYSNAWSGKTDSFQQVIEWHNFMGSGQFCFKACDPAGPDAAKFCEHVYDRIGCEYNAPNAAKNGTFESCLGENQDFPGIYTENGAVVTYKQPAEALGEIATMPYTPRVPASSSCTPFTSSVLYAAIGTPTASAGASGSGPASSKPTGATPSGGSGSATPSATGTGAASALGVSLVSSVLGVVFAAVFLS